MRESRVNKIGRTSIGTDRSLRHTCNDCASKRRARGWSPHPKTRTMSRFKTKGRHAKGVRKRPVNGVQCTPCWTSRLPWRQSVQQCPQCRARWEQRKTKQAKRSTPSEEPLSAEQTTRVSRRASCRHNWSKWSTPGVLSTTQSCRCGKCGRIKTRNKPGVTSSSPLDPEERTKRIEAGQIVRYGGGKSRGRS